MWTGSASKIFKSSYQDIRFSLQQKIIWKNAFCLFHHYPFKTVEGLEKQWNIFCNGLKINVFPQLAGPTTKIFLPFPQPRSRAEMIAVENSFFGKLFFCTVILAHLSHSPRQSSTHSLEQNLFKISILGIFHLFRFSPECSISHVVSITFWTLSVCWRT